MPGFADLRRQAQQARGEHQRSADALAAARDRLHRAETRLADLQRSLTPDDDVRVRERDRLAVERERAAAALAEHTDAHTRAVAGLHAAIAELAPHTDPREGIGELDDGLPILLLPMRVETRFKTVDVDVDGASRPQLWVRVFPDVCGIDTFEAALSDDELTSARRYWVEHWAAGGITEDQRAAWRGLVGAHGVGRATWITQQHAPGNPGDEPAKPRRADVVLVVTTAAPPPAAEADALSTYWQAVWRADGDAGQQDAARATLDAAVGAARAEELVAGWRPANLDTDPPAALGRGDVNVDLAYCVLPAPEEVETKPHAWSRAPTAPLLPDRFVFLGYRGDAPPVVAVGAPVVTPLVVGMDPAATGDDQLHQADGELVVPEPMAWMVDFDRAVDVGMGLRVPLDEAAARSGFDRVLVVGLRLSADPDTAQVELEALLEHHRFGTTGLSVLPQGTPTNNTEGTSSQPDPDEDADGSFDDRAAGPLFTPELDWLDKRDGQWLAELLGIDPDVLVHVRHAGGRDQADARAMNAALWPATLGYWMETMMDPVFDRDDVARTRDFFIHYVSGRGPVPALRIGDMPYGVQLATALPRLTWPRGGDDVVVSSVDGAGDDYLLRLYTLLRRVDADWAEMAGDVAHVGSAGDAHEILLDLVGLHGGSVEFSQRYAESVEALFNKLNLGGLGPLLAALIVGGIVQSGTDLLAGLGYTGEEPDQLRMLFFGRHNLLSGPLVDERPPSETEPLGAATADGRSYLRWLIDAARTSLDALYAQRELEGGPPRALLYLLLRHALQLGYHDTSLLLRESAGLLDAQQVRTAKREPTFLHVAEQVQVSESHYRPLLAAEPAVTGSDTMPVGDFIGAQLDSIGVAGPLRGQLRALERLAGASTARLERALVEHIDCCSYRLDAWWLGLISYQLAGMRGLRPAGRGPVIERAAGQPGPRRGVHLGAYAWLEDVRPERRAFEPVELPDDLAAVFDTPGAPPLQRDAANQGWIHAPSLDHAVAAAVLRNGYLSDAGPDHASTLAVNLTSERVRTAVAMLEGIRSGQRLGALLGYQLERGLHDRHGLAEVDKFIYPLRKAFPLAADRLASTRTDDDVAIEAIEARNVVDGLKLVEHLRAGGDSAYPFGKPLPEATAAEVAAIDAEVQRLLDSHDAVADLALAEGVYQAVRGNYDRVASTYDAYSKGDFPPEPDVVRTPSTGVGVTHRVALHLTPGLDPTASPLPGIPVTPRAHVEPALNAWLAQVLPAPADVGCVAAFRDAATGDPAEAEITLAALALQPLDLLRLLRGYDDQAMTEFDDRVVRAVVAAHDPRPDAPVEVRYTETDGALFSVFEVMPLVMALRRLTDAARPVVPTDLALVGEAALGDDADVSLAPARVLGVRDDLAALRADLDARRATLQTLLDDLETALPDLLDDVDAHADAVVDLLARAAGFGLPQAGWAFVQEARRRVFTSLRARTGELVTAWDARLVEFDALLAEEAALPATATDAERVALLARAEPLVSTQRLSPLPDDPADFRADLQARRATFASARDAFAALAATAGTSVSALLADARDAISTPPIADLDDDGFPLDAEVGEVVGLARDATTTLTVVLAEVDARLATAQARIDEHDAAGEAPARVRALVAVAEALLGADVVVVPELGLGADAAAELGNAVAASDDLLAHARGPAGVELPVDTWLYGAARTRAQLRLWEQVVLFAGALGRAEPELVPLQLPHRPGDTWVALEIPPDYPMESERLCYTACLPPGFDGSGRLCALLLDEWSEVIPTADTTTGVAFHYDQPNAEAPQSFLLVTPTDFRGAWRWDDLVDALHATLDLAKRRAVEPAQIDASRYAPFLPATVMAVTVAQLSISANLALNNAVQAVVGEG